MSLPKYYTDPFVSAEAYTKYGEDLCNVAAHEAGHFVMSILVDGSLPRGLSVVPAGDSDGRVIGAGCFSNGIEWIQQPSVWQREFIRRDVLMLLSGAVVEGTWDAYFVDTAWSGDYAAAAAYLAKVGERIEDVADDYARFVYGLLKYKRARRAIRTVVDTILVRREVDCDNGLYDLYDLVEKTLGDYRQRARRRIAEWTQARDKNTNAQAMIA